MVYLLQWNDLILCWMESANEFFLIKIWMPNETKINQLWTQLRVEQHICERTMPFAWTPITAVVVAGFLRVLAVTAYTTSTHFVKISNSDVGQVNCFQNFTAKFDSDCLRRCKKNGSCQVVTVQKEAKDVFLCTLCAENATHLDVNATYVFPRGNKHETWKLKSSVTVFNKAGKRYQCERDQCDKHEMMTESSRAKTSQPATTNPFATITDLTTEPATTTATTGDTTTSSEPSTTLTTATSVSETSPGPAITTTTSATDPATTTTTEPTTPPGCPSHFTKQRLAVTIWRHIASGPGTTRRLPARMSLQTWF